MRFLGGRQPNCARQGPCASCRSAASADSAAVLACELCAALRQHHWAACPALAHTHMLGGPPRPVALGWAQAQRPVRRSSMERHGVAACLASSWDSCPACMRTFCNALLVVCYDRHGRQGNTAASDCLWFCWAVSRTLRCSSCAAFKTCRNFDVSGACSVLCTKFASEQRCECVWGHRPHATRLCGNDVMMFAAGKGVLKWFMPKWFMPMHGKPYYCAGWCLVYSLQV